MVSLLKKQSNNKIGLDISPEGVYITHLMKKGDKFSLENYAFRPFDKQMHNNNHIENFETLTNDLKAIIDEYAPNSRNIITSVPSSLVFIKKMAFPNLPVEELKTIAPQEAAKHLPLTMKELNVDFQVLEKPGENPQNTSDVIICAISKAIVNNYLDATFNANLNIEAIDVSSFAMIKALAHAEMINNPQKTYISVLVDYGNTDINIIRNGMPVFSYNIETGRKNIIENTANTLNKRKEDVLQLLSNTALMTPGSEMSENPELNKASGAVKNIYSNIAGEIQKTIEFFNSDSTIPVEIEEILISGSGVCVQNIDKYLYNKLKIKTTVFNPFTNLSEEMEKRENILSPINLPSFTTSIGLALKGLEN